MKDKKIRMKQSKRETLSGSPAALRLGKGMGKGKEQE